MRAGVAHLIPAPFTQQVARALEEQSALSAVYCTLVDQPELRWQRLACQFAALAGIDLRRDLRRRAITEVPAERVCSYPHREVFRMGQVRLLGNPVLGDRVFHWGRDGFEAWVARQLEGLDLIYGYEYGALKIFQAAQRQGIRTVYDLPSPEHDFVERLLAPEFARFPELITPYRKHTLALQAERTERRRQEWELADLVIANSSFTARSWQEAGWSPRRVEVVPYGAPPPITTASEGPPIRPLRLLWAGTFSIRKGAHLLLEAVRALEVSPSNLVIDVYGAQGLPPSLLATAPANIVFHGSIPRPELLVHMQQAHALLFPTLCDGFGLVVNEAFSQGLPVITTSRAGAADLVRPGENGWLIEAGSTQAIATVIDQALKDPSVLNQWRPAALATAAEWQWGDYRRRISELVINQ
ncbi:MAG: glycosyltransferase family 4 protein [Prochlorococcaceae cyanobacterium]|jgi:glycosyltransferase involved in cell wall biosynthesis